MLLTRIEEDCLSSLPGSNGVQRADYSDVFGQFTLTMRYMQLKVCCIVALRTPKPGRTLDPEVAYVVENFRLNECQQSYVTKGLCDN